MLAAKKEMLRHTEQVGTENVLSVLCHIVNQFLLNTNVQIFHLNLIAIHYGFLFFKVGISPEYFLQKKSLLCFGPKSALVFHGLIQWFSIFWLSTRKLV
jgi:hypothetical protein